MTKKKLLSLLTRVRLKLSLSAKEERALRNWAASLADKVSVDDLTDWWFSDTKGLKGRVKGLLLDPNFSIARVADFIHRFNLKFLKEHDSRRKTHKS